MDKALEKIRHSTSHVLAIAVKELFPKAKLGIGPAIDSGFYYDFDNLTITQENLKKIEKKMKEIIKRNISFKKIKISKAKAKTLLKNEPYKLELLEDLKDKTISFYESGNFQDLCKGPHISSTKNLKHFKLLSVAGAYWKGDSKNKMLTRIYGTAFIKEKELKKFLIQREEAEARNHIRLGKDLGIFTINKLVGKGLPIWLPKGNVIKEEIEKFAKEKEDQAGFQRVTTPHLAKKELFTTSGHLPYYEESMYPSMKMDDGTYYLRAMNCPHHHLIYKHKLRSYRDLPLRLAEYGTCYRNELSGTLAGLLRVRMLSMNDAHTYCTKDQIEKEFSDVIKMIQDYYKVFGFENYWFRLSKGDTKNKKKYVNDPKNWKSTEETLRKVLKKLKVKFTEAEDEASFYGPKVDIQFTSVSGREESMSTIQLDFAAKERFGLQYQDKNGEMNKEVFVIHRAPLSTHERFIAFLIEHYAGKFPVWLAPTQVRILSLTDRNKKYVEKLQKDFKKLNLRVDVDIRSESMSKKVRDAQTELIPITITIGDKEQKAKTLAIRTIDGKIKFGVKNKDFLKKITQSIEQRKDANY
ncbi:MAG: threonine--tRNA ligase [Nanoarchaeota archaeon]|nr:threonine--tRNA ligase [Nanoarchaeota archaeon]